jgi:hypothetical protein
MKQKVLKKPSCLNCDFKFGTANYCPNCGQKNDARRITFWQLVRESLSNFFAFDGRFFKTFKNLLIRPGLVPKHYKQGKRVRYMHPVRLYFMCSVIMLFLVNRSDESRSQASLSFGNNPSASINLNTEAKANDKMEEEVNVKMQTLDSPNNQKQPVVDFENQEVEEAWFPAADDLWMFREFNAKNPQVKDSVALQELEMPVNIWNLFLFKQAVKSNTITQEEYNRFASKNFFWILFLFVPVIGLWLKIFYWRHSIFYPEHLFFAFFNQSVLFMLFCIASLTQSEQTGFTITVLIYGIYLLWALKTFYEQSNFKTFVKFLMLNTFVIFSFVVFVILSLIINFLIY